MYTCTLTKFKSDGTIGRKPRSGRKSKVMAEIKAIIQEPMKDNETTAFQLKDWARANLAEPLRSD